ncbi:nucleotidyltransferase family protein [Methanospirillum stamsii]|uniref:protein adenylyltransferase n=2 Tax=Methanospirillum stamsii TaxID=1277351 RepID=A0A2V2NCW7_9EURY|nr:nucleotidyltransferase [Methanospirillum stamsii]
MDVLREINIMLPDLKRRFGISRIGVFGSQITGNASPGSDIDILVTFEEGKETFDNYMDLKFFLEDKFGNRVDLVIEDSIKSRLKDRIIKETVFA